MTYLVITDNLIDNLDDLEINELKYEKIKSDEISNSCLLYTSDAADEE